MAATRITAGTYREVWQDTAPLDGGSTLIVHTGIRANTISLSQVFGILSLRNIAGVPDISAVASISANGHLDVALTNAAAPGNSATWQLNVVLTHSIQQARDPLGPGCIYVIGPSGGNGGGNLVVENIAELRTWEGGVGPTANKAAVVKGYYAPADGGGNEFMWTVDVATPDNGGTVIVPTALPRHGCWKAFNFGSISVRCFGAVGDGIVLDTVAIQNALNCGLAEIVLPAGDFLHKDLDVPNNTILRGLGWASRLHPSSAGAAISVHVNTGLDNLRIEGTCSVTIGVGYGGAADTVAITNCFFANITAPIIAVYTASNVLIENCTFTHTGYGVLQATGFVSSHVKVTNCTAQDMLHDFVECNCTGAALSVDWIISNNQYLGNHGYPTPATESRFVGATGITGLTITHNNVRNTCGDSAIHIEAASGNVIVTDNRLENCAGNRSYLWAFAVNNDFVIADNYFVQSDLALPAAFAVNLTDYRLTTSVTLLGNKFIGNVNRTLSGVSIQTRDGVSMIGNTFDGCDVALQLFHAGKGTFSQNTIRNTNTGIADPVTANSGSDFEWTIAGNRFYTDNACIEIRRNSNGTGPASAWLVFGNYFGNDATGYDTVDFTVFGNTTALGHTIDFGLTQYGGPLHYNAFGNFQDGVGPITAQTSFATALLAADALPTSAVGLPSGAFWRDPGAANVVKCVP